MSIDGDNNSMMTFGGHLEVFRWMLFRVVGVMAVFSIAIFCFKDIVWTILLAPSEWDFVTYRGISSVAHAIGLDNVRFGEFYIELIATDLSSQFMTHIMTSLYLGMLLASPYILYELFCFISPALYEHERRYSVIALIIIYILFIVGVLLTYFVIFPISFNFLGNYSVSERVHSTITLDSYISTFTTLTLLMGLVFQLPVIAYTLGKFGLITSEMLAKYRKYAFMLILIISAIITPPDIFTCILVTIPLYLLYEVSIRVVR